MPGKQVSQETFDAVVREAISDFGLSPEDALTEAKEQLSAAGVTDFSNVITSIPSDSGNDHPVVSLVSDLEASLSPSSVDDSAVIAALLALAEAASADPETRGVAGARGAVAAVASAIPVVPGPACEAVSALCNGNEINRAAFLREAGAMTALVNAVKLAAEPNEATSADAGPCKMSTRDVCSILGASGVVMSRSEDAKSSFAAGARALDSVLAILSCARAVAALVRACCGVFRALLTVDDSTKLATETFNRARVLCGSSSVMESGLVPLADETTPLPETLFAVMSDLLRSSSLDHAAPSGDSHIRALVDCMVVARQCAISDEICASMVELGYLNLVESCLSSSSLSLPLSRPCVGLLRSIAARDQAKAVICDGMSYVAAAVSQRPDDVQLLDRFCGLVAALCLRRPDLAQRLQEEHKVGDTILQAMKMHSDAEGLQVAGCNALRNIVVRSAALGQSMREDGRAEKLLRTALDRFPVACRDVAYNALHALDVLEDGEMRRDRRYTTPF